MSVVLLAAATLGGMAWMVVSLLQHKCPVEYAGLVGRSKAFYGANMPQCDYPNSEGGPVARYRQYLGGTTAGAGFEAQIVADAKEVGILLDRETGDLLRRFLRYKIEGGTLDEKALYKDMTVKQFARRLVSKRAVVFFMEDDTYTLRGGNGVPHSGGYTPGETEGVALVDYITEDERMLSPLLSASVPTTFTSNCSKSNSFGFGQLAAFEKHGIITGSVGARFEKKNASERALMLIEESVHTSANGFGRVGSGPRAPWVKMWAEFYGVAHLATYDEARQAIRESDARFKQYTVEGAIVYLDTGVYFKRIYHSVLPVLLDANRRASQAGKMAHIRATGIGLGVWAIADQQAQRYQAGILVSAWSKALEQLPQVHNIAAIEFNSFLAAATDDSDMIKKNAAKKGVGISFTHYTQGSDKCLASPVPDERLLVMQFAWDGGSFVGNEYWLGMFKASMDPAAASCSMIADLMNPDINGPIENWGLEVLG